MGLCLTNVFAKNSLKVFQPWPELQSVKEIVKGFITR